MDDEWHEGLMEEEGELFLNDKLFVPENAC